MGIFDFLKKKQEVDKTKLKIENIDKYLKEKKDENQKKEKRFFEEVKTSLNELTNELNEKNKILKNVNLDEKKADPRAKFIIRENLSTYIDRVDKLIDELKGLDSESLADLITDLDSLFIDFKEKSKLNFEKATFLIGKEIGAVKDTINNYTRNLKKNIEENKLIIENSEVISRIEKKLGDLDETIKTIDEINKNINENNLKIKTTEGNIADTEIETEKIKSSENYKKEISLEAELNVKNEELEKEAYRLKDMIDFKKLANLFHYDSKKMTTINEYKLNFINIFKKDKLLSLVPLLDEANMADSFITQKTNEIMKREKEIEKIKKEFNKSESNSISDMDKKLSTLRTDMDYTNREIAKEEKRKDKSENSRNEILAALKQEFVLLDVDLNIE
jgi:hypothetical protein